MSDWPFHLSLRYPGVGCDVPSHSYNFTFEPNPEWNGYYSYGDQIQEYFVNFARKYDLERYIQFEAAVVNATWMDKDGQCTDLPYFD